MAHLGAEVFLIFHNYHHHAFGKNNLFTGINLFIFLFDKINNIVTLVYIYNLYISDIIIYI